VSFLIFIQENDFIIKYLITTKTDNVTGNATGIFPKTIKTGRQYTRFTTLHLLLKEPAIFFSTKKDC
jgi:hypothetical protein